MYVMSFEVSFEKVYKNGKYGVHKCSWQGGSEGWGRGLGGWGLGGWGIQMPPSIEPGTPKSQIQGGRPPGAVRCHRDKETEWRGRSLCCDDTSKLEMSR